MTYIILQDPDDDDRLYEIRGHAFQDCAFLNREAAIVDAPVVYRVHELQQAGDVNNPLCANCRIPHPRSAHDLDSKHRPKRCTVATDRDGVCECTQYREATDA